MSETTVREFQYQLNRQAMIFELLAGILKASGFKYHRGDSDEWMEGEIWEELIFDDRFEFYIGFCASTRPSYGQYRIAKSNGAVCVKIFGCAMKLDPEESDWQVTDSEFNEEPSKKPILEGRKLAYWGQIFKSIGHTDPLFCPRFYIRDQKLSTEQVSELVINYLTFLRSTMPVQGNGLKKIEG